MEECYDTGIIISSEAELILAPGCRPTLESLPPYPPLPVVTGEGRGSDATRSVASALQDPAKFSSLLGDETTKC